MRRVIAAFTSIVFISAFPVAAAAQERWKPERTVEILTGTAAGGALDRTARLIQSILQEQKLVDAPVQVVNKIGGGGAVSWAYMNQRPGDGHLLSVTSVVLMTNKITGSNPITYTDVTPIVQLLSEYVAITVRTDSPLRNGRDFIERLRADPSSIRFGLGTSLGASSHIGIALVAKAAGIDVKKLKFAVFKSGGESAVAVLGGHVDVVGSSAGNYLNYVKAGQMRVLGIAAPQRLGGVFADAPTWRELGVDAVFANWRGIAGPRGMSAAQIAYWDEVFAKMVRHEAWQKQCETIMCVETFMGNAETRKFLEAQYRELHAILSEVGLAK